MKLSEKNYIERDESWMTFNHRILEEAQRKTIPTFERLTFLGIYSNNLDEFFRVRVATLNRIVEYADKASKDLRVRSEKTLKVINKLNNKFAKEFETTVHDVTKALGENHIHLLSERDLSEEQKSFVKDYCQRNVVGAISPTWLSAIKELTASADDNIFLAVRLQKWHEDKKKPDRDYAILELPVKQFGRFVQLPTIGEDCYIMYVDDVLRCALPYMFPGLDYTQYEAWSFKFTKDAEMEIDTDIRGGMLQKISKGVKSRKNGLPVRMIYDEQMPKDLLKKIMEKLNISSLDTMLTSGRYQNHKDLMKWPDCGRSDLKYPKWPAIMPAWAQDAVDGKSLIEKIREKDRISLQQLQSLYGQLASLTVEERMQKFELRPDRADVIVPAAQLFMAVASAVGATEIAVPALGLADGIINELAAKHSEITSDKN